MAKRSSISPTLTVFGVWWLATAYFAPAYDLHSMAQSATLTAFGVLLGVVGALVTIAVVRVGYRGMTAPTELRGLRCSIGEVPMPMPPPERAEELPPVSPVTAPDIPADFIDNWLDEYAEEYPGHARLFKALLMVLNHRPNLPATHIAGGHGGRTLLQHSLLTAWIMTEVSRTWEYDGIRDRTGKRILVPLRDKEYRFVHRDPMVAIIGLAHDIGKIEAYIYSENGNIVGCRAEHDLTGSRMIARMEEAWDIPMNDRDAMMLAIAHYHHPVELPMAPDQRRAVARDDRTIALMELLIRADFTVTRLEYDGQMPTDEEYKSLDSIRTVSPEQLYDEFVALIHESHRVNSGNLKYSIGQISPDPSGKNGLLYLHEESLRIQMMRRLSMQTTEHLGNGRYQITVDLLNILKARGVLYTTHEGLDYSPGNAMWVCDIIGSKDQKIADWPCVIAVKLNNFEKLQQLGFFSSSVKIKRNRFGIHMGRQPKEEVNEAAVLGGLGSNNDIPETSQPKKPKKAAPKPVKKPVAEPKPIPAPHVVAEAVTAVPQPVQATPEAEEGAHAAVEIADDQSAPQEQPAAGQPEPLETLPASVQPVQHDAPAAENAPAETEAVPPETPQTQENPALSEPRAKREEAKIEAIVSLDLKAINEAILLAVNLGQAGTLKCRQGESGNFVFNLDTLISPESPVAPTLSAPGVLDYLASGKCDGVGITRINKMTLVSVVPKSLAT